MLLQQIISLILVEFLTPVDHDDPDAHEVDCLDGSEPECQGCQYVHTNDDGEEETYCCPNCQVWYKCNVRRQWVRVLLRGAISFFL